MAELVFLFSADADIQTAYEFYEARQTGRGEIFMHRLNAAFGQIRAFPASAPLFHNSYRRLLVHRSPYGIFYSIEGNRIVVSAVMNLRQDLDTIRRRLGG